MADVVAVVLQLLVGFGLLNVWLLRRRKATPWRGGGAASMVDEFREYGLPKWSVAFVGTVKVGAALALIAGIWVPVLVQPAALVLVLLMSGAVVMHIRCGDPAKRSLPAGSVLAMVIALAAIGG